MTLFSGEGGAGNNLLSILEKVVLHHESHIHLLAEVEVYGADATDAVCEAFRLQGFSRFEWSPNGFVAHR